MRSLFHFHRNSIRNGLNVMKCTLILGDKLRVKLFKISCTCYQPLLTDNQ